MSHPVFFLPNMMRVLQGWVHVVFMSDCCLRSVLDNDFSGLEGVDFLNEIFQIGPQASDAFECFNPDWLQG